jgi:hypothetical protein
MRIEVENWPMRRRAMISLLQNPRQPKILRSSLKHRAEKLAELCEENNHPMCAQIIRLYLVGIKTDIDELMRYRK